MLRCKRQISSRISKVRKALQTIEKIWSGNMLRLLRQAEVSVKGRAEYQVVIFIV